ncbi:MAG TPA: hypothetical protein VJ895_00430 [Candidatus Nanoarchaeia archaeon]|nr:hypothetical protein [Candidatus Nanoarchaeia archaeon]
MKIIHGTKFSKKLSYKERHVRWNWEKSPEGDFVRYHFVVVDDRFRRAKMNQILESLTEVNYGAERIRSEEGKVEGTKFRYLFESYDSRTAPSFLKLDNLRAKRDKDLLERKKGSIENYVADIYERK